MTASGSCGEQPAGGVPGAAAPGGGPGTGLRGGGKAVVTGAAAACSGLVIAVAQLPWQAVAVPVRAQVPGGQAAPGLIQAAIAAVAAATFAAFADGPLRRAGAVLVTVASLLAAALAVRVAAAPGAIAPWPWVAAALAAAAGVAGAAAWVLAPRWGGSPGRFQRRSAGAGPAGAVSDWDRLSRGEDPTAADEVPSAREP